MLFVAGIAGPLTGAQASGLGVPCKLHIKLLQEFTAFEAHRRNACSPELIRMTPAEHRLLTLTLAWILASIPLALLAFQVWLKPRLRHPVIPHEDAVPAGSFLDVALPPPLPSAGESGLPVRQWKKWDGWVAILTVFVLSFLMGPLSMEPENTAKFKVSGGLMLMQLVFQLGMSGMLLFYLAGARGFKPVELFGLRRQPLLMVPAWALAWIVPGTIAVGIITALTMPWLLQYLGQDAASPQMIVKALGETPDSLTKLSVAVTVGLGAPFMEELFFRGFLYGVAKRFTHWTYAALGSSLFFAVVHGNVMSLLPLTLLGLLFTAAYEQTRSLLVPMVMHSIFNLFQIAVMFYAPQLAQQLDKA